jgi:hypothetical protein
MNPKLLHTNSFQLGRKLAGSWQVFQNNRIFLFSSKGNSRRANMQTSLTKKHHRCLDIYLLFTIQEADRQA